MPIFYRLLDTLNNQSWFPYYFLTPLYYSVGNAAEEIFFALAWCKRKEKKLIILEPYSVVQVLDFNICNETLFRITSPYSLNQGFLKKASEFYLNFFFFFYRLIAIKLRSLLKVKLPEDYYFPRIGIKALWVPKKAQKFCWNENLKMNWQELLENVPDSDLSKKDNKELVTSFEALGLTNEKYVCLHVREAGFKADFGRRPYRNADIKTYIPAIKHLIASGYKVVRMGDSTMEPLPRIEGLIDYPFLPQKSPGLDLYLIKNCSFYIGMQSGILDVALMFKVPVLMLNMYNWTHLYPLKPCDRGMIKQFYDKKLQRFLSLKELYSGPWGLQNTEGYLDERYEVFDNSPEELLSGVKDYLSQNEDQAKNLQALAKEARSNQARVLFQTTDCPKGENICELPLLEQYRYSSRIDSAKGLLCPTYLRGNWESSSRLES